MPADLMVDLETLGRRAGCVVLSIGAVEFSPAKGLGREFYCVLTQDDQRAAGLRVDPETEAWWAGQSAAARKVFEESAAGAALSLSAGLFEFRKFCRALAPQRALRVWGNGASFDNAILCALYATNKEDLPWEFWNDRCYRTLKSFHGAPPLPKRTGTYHNALDDAKTQAEHAVLIMNAKGLRE